LSVRIGHSRLAQGFHLQQKMERPPIKNPDHPGARDIRIS
jgi:hypothetical protein